MVLNWKISIILLVSLTLSMADTYESNPSSNVECITPMGIFGSCIPLEKCGGLLDILSEAPLNAERVKTLQRSTCNFVRNQPFVCCSPEDDHPSVSSRNQATSMEETPSLKVPTAFQQDNAIPDRGTTKFNGPNAGIENHPNFPLLPTIQSCGVSFSSDRIIGGTDAGLGTFPWMALLSFKDPSGGYQLACGGTLINAQYVLTASHCISRLPPGFSVSHIRLGEYDESTNPDCENYICAPKYQEIPVETLITHERYDSTGNHDNDIALIRMSRPADLSSAFVKPVCLPYGDILTQCRLETSRPIIAGWGRTRFDSSQGSSVLQKVNIPALTEQDCNSIFDSHRMARIDHNSQFCAGGESGRDSCKGDSGGPLMANVFNGRAGSSRTWQFGVVSYGPKECGTTIPAVYTRVSYFLPWILDHIRP
ncbi:unnamed protein product [Allacma fusca]|uniref:CLIP domain-containing serine protease n=1 Tax=Allacma fusca TaxID=39272 RepID=A0A8J2LN09_9HEXA|nr:unnamed protein product [Allacma fusca]